MLYRTAKLLATALLLLALTNCREAITTVSVTEEPDDIQEIVRWLPETAHNFFVVKAPLTYYLDNCQPFDPESMFELPIVQGLLNSPIKAVGRSIRWIKPKDILWCAATLDGNTMNKDATWCSFGFLAEDNARDDLLMKNMAMYADTTCEVCGSKIYGFAEITCPEDKDPVRTHYDCLLMPRLVVSSNDKEYIAKILRRRRDNAAPVALKASLPEWSSLDTGSSYWGLWDFNANEAKQIEGAHSHGYNFSYDRSTRMLHLRYWLAEAGTVLPLLKLLGIPDSARRSLIRDPKTNGLDSFEYTIAPDKEGFTTALAELGALGGGLPGVAKRLKEW